jgi:hypothetical protein
MSFRAGLGAFSSFRQRSPQELRHFVDRLGVGQPQVRFGSASNVYQVIIFQMEAVMRTALSLTICALALLAGTFPAVGGNDKKEEKKSETLLIQVSAGELAEEFRADSIKAAKKYNPNPPMKGAQGGAIIVVNGEVMATNEKNLTFKTGSTVGVMVRLTNDAGMPAGRFIATVTGKFKETQKNTVYLEGELTKTKPIIDNK